MLKLINYKHVLTITGNILRIIHYHGPITPIHVVIWTAPTSGSFHRVTSGLLSRTLSVPEIAKITGYYTELTETDGYFVQLMTFQLFLG